MKRKGQQPHDPRFIVGADSRLGVGCNTSRGQKCVCVGGRSNVLLALQRPAGERASGEAGDPTVPRWQWATLCARAD